MEQPIEMNETIRGGPSNGTSEVEQQPSTSEEAFASCCEKGRFGHEREEERLPCLVPVVPFRVRRGGARHQGAFKWVWTSLSDRSDGAAFCHWVRIPSAREDGFCGKYDRTLDLRKYTDEEYERYLVSDQWSREETEHLWDLCARFDLRFVVIADRWNTNGNTTCRTIEELMDRYYSIQRLLLQVRNSDGSDLSNHWLFLCRHDSTLERERKCQEAEMGRSHVDKGNELAECARLESTFSEHRRSASRTLKLIRRHQKYSALREAERRASERHPASKRPSAPPFSARSIMAYVGHLMPRINRPEFRRLLSAASESLGIDLTTGGSPAVASLTDELKCDILMLYELQRLHAEKSYELHLLSHLHRSMLAETSWPNPGEEQQLGQESGKAFEIAPGERVGTQF